MKTLLAKLVAGAVAGLLAWAILEPLKPQSGTVDWAKWEAQLILAYGAMVGLVIGGYDGYTRGGKVHFFRGLGLGLLFGGIGGMIGYQIGASVEGGLFGPQIFDGHAPIVEVILARTIVLCPLGLMVGAAIGASSLTLKRTVQGAIGGGIGGLIGGLTFDLIGSAFAGMILSSGGQTQGEVGGPSRAVAFAVMGGAIGLFIGLVEQFTRSAWLRIDYGRNEFKEWSIDSAETFLGRSESATVPLRGDPNVQPIHAVIRKQGSEYVLQDGGSPIGTVLNGQFVQQAILSPGSTIQIGSHVLQFLIKGVPAPAAAPHPHSQAYQPYGAAQPGHPGHPHQPQGYPPPPNHQVYGFPNGSPPGGLQGVPSGAQTVAFAPQQAAAPIGALSLVAMDGPLAGQRFPATGPLEIGREGAQIRLASDANASRRHASVSPFGTGLLVGDLGSTNGTFVNGQRIQSQEVRSGDLIRIGNTSFRVESG